jgi:uncharacterized protein YjiS (DUF1127 family)
MSLIPALPRSDARSLSAIGLDAATPSIRRTADGRIDFEHYLLRARELRARSYAGAFGAIARAVSGVLKALRDRRARKRALAELLSLDDRSLRDLGLNRAGVIIAVDHGREDAPAPANANEKPSRSVA